MLKKILYALLILIGLLLVVGLFLNGAFHVERSTVIAAPPETIHREAGDLARWKDWAPWNMDSDEVRIQISEPSSGSGATLSWTDRGGSGRLTITDASPQSGLDYELHIGEDTPPARASIHYQPLEQGTRVTWRIDGAIETPILGGYLALLATKSIGAAFDKGLRQLKARVESQGQSPSP